MLTEIAIFKILVYLIILALLIKPLGWYMYCIYEKKWGGLNKIEHSLEKSFYRWCGIFPEKEMNWKNYLSAMLIFNFFGLLLVYFIQRLQFFLPLNPQSFAAIPPDLAFNTAISFATNTNWQAYGGETTLSYFTQMFALTVQNFLSAATGLSLLIVLARGLARNEATNLGNFWVDTVRGIIYILLPLATILAFILVSQGVIQNLRPYQAFSPLQMQTTPQIQQQSVQQIIPMGPVASQVAIKQLGTNGGGFFNTNSAHPFENPTPISNFFELLAILLLPASLCYTFSLIVNDRRQGWAILAAMFIIFIPFLLLAIYAEQQGNPAFTHMGIDQSPLLQLSPGGNMEGKEMRFGVINSALWATATAATSNGSVNSMLDSYTPLGGLVPLWLMHLGEVVFGGVGSGLYGMIMLILMTVFVAGLMVGRTPEYLGKKIEPYEMKMAAMAVLVMPLIVLFATALGTSIEAGASAVGNPGAHGFTEILYAFTSMGNNNGSAFAGLGVNNFFYNIFGGLVILIGRYWIAIPVLAIAGSLVRKKVIPANLGTLASHTPLFVILLVGITIILGALSFLPALALGPIVEHLRLWHVYGG